MLNTILYNSPGELRDEVNKSLRNIRFNHFVYVSKIYLHSKYLLLLVVTDMSDFNYCLIYHKLWDVNVGG
jgi:hypothetical protein